MLGSLISTLFEKLNIRAIRQKQKKKKHNPRKRQSEILTGPQMSKELQKFRLKKELKRKGEVLKNGNEAKIKSSSKLKKTEKTCERNIMFKRM
jgi:hypothetical protein